LCKDSVFLDSRQSVDKKICLFPGLLKRKEQAANVVGTNFAQLLGLPPASYGQLDGDITVSSSIDWEFFIDWLRENPSLLNEIQVRCTDTTQLNNPIELYELTPFGRGRMNTLVPDTAQSQSDANTQLVNVKTAGLQLDSITAIGVVINKNATVNFTFIIGTTNSAAEDLQRAYQL